MSLENCHYGALDVVVCGCPRTDADAHGGPSFPNSSSAPTCAGSLGRSDDALRPLVIPEGDDHLVQDNLVQHFDAVPLHAVGYLSRVTAVAAHQVGQADTSEELKRRPYLNGSGAPGAVRREVHGVSVFASRKI